MRDCIEPIVLPKALELLKQHRDAGDKLVIITATNRFVTAPIAVRLGVETLIATECEMVDGRYTGRSTDIPCFREGKVTRLNRWLEETGYSLDDSYFYSDSMNDLPLLEQVANPVAVDPDPNLRAEAEKRSWPVITWRDGYRYREQAHSYSGAHSKFGTRSAVGVSLLAMGSTRREVLNRLGAHQPGNRDKTDKAEQRQGKSEPANATRRLAQPIQPHQQPEPRQRRHGVQHTGSQQPGLPQRPADQMHHAPAGKRHAQQRQAHQQPDEHPWPLQSATTRRCITFATRQKNPDPQTQRTGQQHHGGDHVRGFQGS
jgi:hypothetical protein